MKSSRFTPIFSFVATLLLALFACSVVILPAFAAEITASDAASFRDAVSNAADGDTIKVAADFTINEEVTIPTGQTLNIDLDGHTITAQGLPAESSLLAGKDVTVTVQNGSFTSADGTARAALLEGSNSTFTNVNFKGFGGVYMGGAICARYNSSTIGTATSLTLTGCTFDNNTANIGGAVAVLGVDNVNVKNCTFTNNSANASVAVPSGHDNFSASRGSGGALAHLAQYESNNAEGYQFTLEGNTFDYNTAENRGGAIHFMDLYSITTNLVSGTFTNNSADWGGAIDYTMHHQPPLKLTNVLITENDAVRGGGLWVCPQGTLSIGYNLGGSIFGNTATGQTMSEREQGTMLSAAGDDICNEGVDSIDISPQLDGGPGAPVTVVPGGIGGVQTQWFSDAADNRYQEGADEADPNVYTNASNSFALHGEVSSDGAAIARSEAKVIFTNNHAKSRGGAIATNSPIEIGIEEDTASVALSKHYADLTSLADAPEVSGIVYRVDAQGNRVAIMDDVRLNAGNNWERIVEHLPTVYVDDQGQVQHYSYAVDEQPLEGFELESANLVRSNVVIATVSLSETTMNEYWPDATFKVHLVDSSGADVAATQEMNASNKWSVTWTVEDDAPADDNNLYHVMVEKDDGSLIPFSDAVPKAWSYYGVRESDGLIYPRREEDGAVETFMEQISPAGVQPHVYRLHVGFVTDPGVVANWKSLGFNPEITLRHFQFLSISPWYRFFDPVTLSVSNNWSVPAGKEVEMLPGSGDLGVMYSPNPISLSFDPVYSETYNSRESYVLVNKRTQVTPRIEKIWAEGSEKTAVQIQLQAGEEADSTVVLDESNSWKSDLDKVYLRDETGKKIDYSIKELVVPDHYTVSYADPEITEDGTVLLLKATNTPDKKYTEHYRYEGDLPQAVLDTLPTRANSYWNGTSNVQPANPSATEVKVEGGKWIFKGWDKTNATVNGADIEFVGTWEFVADEKTTYTERYRYEGTLPQAVLDTLPSRAGTYTDGTNVTPAQPSATEVKVEGGKWIFKGWDKTSATVDGADVEFVGVWEFVANESPTPAPDPTPKPEPEPTPEPARVVPQKQTVPQTGDTMLSYSLLVGLGVVGAVLSALGTRRRISS